MPRLSGSGTIRPNLFAPKGAKELLGAVRVSCTVWFGSQTVMVTLDAKRGKNICELTLPENEGDETRLHTPSGRDFYLKVQRHERGSRRGQKMTFTIFIDAARTKEYGSATITLNEED